MAESSQVHLTLVLTVGSAPVSGSVTACVGKPIAFCGWLELMPILEAAAAGELTPPLPGPGTGPYES